MAWETILEGPVSLQVDSLGCRNAQKDKYKLVQWILFVVMSKIKISALKQIRNFLL